MKNALSANYFTGLIGQQITLQVGDQQPIATVAECRELGGETHRETSSPFSVHLKIADQAPYPQGSYIFDLPELGALPIFIVPIGQDEDGVLYEAIFN